MRQGKDIFIVKYRRKRDVRDGFPAYTNDRAFHSRESAESYAISREYDLGQDEYEHLVIDLWLVGTGEAE